MNKAAKNMIYNFIGNIGSKVLSFFVVAYITRVFGSSIFGQYNAVAAEFSYFSMFANFGMSGYGLYLLSKEEEVERRNSLISRLCSVRAITGFIAAVILIAYACLPGTHDYIFIYFILLLLQAFDISWVFYAFQDMRITAFCAIVNAVVPACCVFVFSLLGWKSVYALILAYMIPTVIVYCLYNFYAWRKHRVRIRFSIPPYFTYMKRAFPYMASGLFAGINANIDLVIMGYVLGENQVGYYSADYKLINEFILLCSVVFSPLYPVFIKKIAEGSIEYINRVTGYLRTFLLGAVLPCVITVMFYSGEILGLVFGAEYKNGSTAFIILMLFVFILYYREIYGYLLTGAGKQPLYLRIVMISGSCNIILNLIFIPQFGISAAAATTMVSEIVNFFGMRYYVKKIVGVKIQNYNIQKLVFPAMAMIITFLLCNKVSIQFVIAIILGILLYGVVFLLVGVVDLKVMWKMIKNKEI
ncbi:MAG: flippase [Clostridium sp.]|nr:flippase [Clostridium sp.]